ncbi:leucine-rich repeat extensin-like protein 5 [Neodiprion virginianus]|uniref:leucine-rich repeat extensin-like protein 5 n=1 Tax=Neodiprion virginianus TaxID=2961670 RepID=UPI001EE70CF2|nr:leucine-rich repeat extensin-like protein 5 [Neodiprion virginianus]
MLVSGINCSEYFVRAIILESPGLKTTRNLQGSEPESQGVHHQPPQLPPSHSNHRQPLPTTFVLLDHLGPRRLLRRHPLLFVVVLDHLRTPLTTTKHLLSPPTTSKHLLPSPSDSYHPLPRPAISYRRQPPPATSYQLGPPHTISEHLLPSTTTSDHHRPPSTTPYRLLPFPNTSNHL